MCGRYTLFAPPEELEERFDARFDFEFEPRYNAAPSQELPVVTGDESDVIQRLEWGLVPRWADDDTDRHINARAETVEDKPAFRQAYRGADGDGETAGGRCLVIADGFYDWADTGDGKRPYRVALEDDRPFAMAGLWERWTPDTVQTGLGTFGGDGPDEEPNPVETFTVLTTEPNAVVEPLHHRMAVVLDPGEEAAWLDGGEVPLDPAPADEFRAYPVSTAVNDPSNDRSELVREVGG
ncbi:SOS response-associated peptidase [Natronomonas marina]|uniref:SOS response-associated peptidase n=1 Tax=Natronomonas marina TaxID=2961939 RepID=UPI0020C9EA96|nr:SOS response-associated peptidase [Natronomonas marina]